MFWNTDLWEEKKSQWLVRCKSIYWKIISNNQSHDIFEWLNQAIPYIQPKPSSHPPPDDLLYYAKIKDNIDLKHYKCVTSLILTVLKIWSDPKSDPTSPTPSFLMTYHDLATQLNQTFISQPNLDRSPQNFQHRPTVGKQIWSDPKPDPTTPTLICHDLSWPSHPIKSNLHISAKSWWISTKFSA